MTVYKRLIFTNLNVLAIYVSTSKHQQQIVYVKRGSNEYNFSNLPIWFECLFYFLLLVWTFVEKCIQGLPKQNTKRNKTVIYHFINFIIFIICLSVMFMKKMITGEREKVGYELILNHLFWIIGTQDMKYIKQIFSFLFLSLLYKLRHNDNIDFRFRITNLVDMLKGFQHFLNKKKKIPRFSGTNHI